MTGITIEGADVLLARLTTLAQLKGVGVVIKAAALHLKGKLDQAADSTQGQSHHAQPFKSEKSRRYFFWALKQGKIEVPYRRGMSPNSEKMSHGWSIITSNNGLTATIRNGASYGSLVMGDGKQAQYHRITGWKTDAQIVEENSAEVSALVMTYLEKIVGGTA